MDTSDEMKLRSILFDGYLYSVLLSRENVNTRNNAAIYKTYYVGTKLDFNKIKEKNPTQRFTSTRPE